MGKDLPRIAEIQLDVDDATGRVLATVQNGDGGEFAHFLRDSPDGKWQQFTEFKDRIVQALFGQHDDLFLVSLRDAPAGQDRAHRDRRPRQEAGPDDRRRKARTRSKPASSACRRSWRRRTGCTWSINWAGRRRFARSITRASRRPARRRRRSPRSTSSSRSTGNDLLYGSVSYVKPEGRYVFHAESGETTETALASTSPVNLDDMEVTREFATSKDGTKVPVNIICRKGTKLDGKNPALATGYGGYGVSHHAASSRPTGGFCWTRDS